MFSTWLDQHLEEFVRPQLGKIPNAEPAAIKGNSWAQHWRHKSNVGDLIGILKSARKMADGRTLLLTGRDMFLIYIVAQMVKDTENLVYRPDIARPTMHYVTEDYREHFLLDTGYGGSIPKALKMQHWALISFGGTLTIDDSNKHLYPDGYQSVKFREDAAAYKKAHQLIAGDWKNGHAAMLEGTPKYWYTGEYDQNKKKILPMRIDEFSFESAAICTMIVARNIVPQPKQWAFASKSRMWRYL